MTTVQSEKTFKQTIDPRTYLVVYVQCK